MNVTIISVGAQPKATIASLIEDYTKRLPKNIHVSWRLLKHGPDDPTISVTHESESIMRILTKQQKVILLDESGDNLTSEQLSAEIFQTDATDIVFVIGGAYGVNDTVKQRADKTIAFGKCVFPHQIMRLMLAEQIYRSYCIHVGHPYHHA